MRVVYALILFLFSLLTAYANPIVESAREQIGVTVSYDPSYRMIGYPNGDVERSTGVCTDVIVRALRDASRIDLQREVNSDMRANFSQYPKIWGLKRTDRNIDHRRVPNLRTYFQRKGYSLGTGQKKIENYQPGDLITCTVAGNRPHIMIVSDKKTATGVPYVIHNIGRGTQEENSLFSFPITGHYRIKSK